MPLDDRIDLLLREHAAGALREGRHRRAAHAVGDDARASTRSSTIARYTGLASAIAAPPRPSAPWQPAQLSAYSAPNSTTSFGASVSEPVRGWPGGVPQPDEQHRAERRGSAQRHRECVHGRALSPRGGIVPGASMPARRANERFSQRRHPRLPHDDEAGDDAEGHLRRHEPEPVDAAREQRIQEAQRSDAAGPTTAPGRSVRRGRSAAAGTSAASRRRAVPRAWRRGRARPRRSRSCRDETH